MGRLTVAPQLAYKAVTMASMAVMVLEREEEGKEKAKKTGPDKS